MVFGGEVSDDDVRTMIQKDDDDDDDDENRCRRPMFDGVLLNGMESVDNSIVSTLLLTTTIFCANGKGIYVTYIYI
jgi:hypothetical protein